MFNALAIQQSGSTHTLCTTYDAHDPAFLEKILPFVSYIEVTPDTIARALDDRITLNASIINSLRDVLPSVEIIAHGVGLSIGSYDGCSRAYLTLLDELFETIPLAWHSEHLGYVSINGENLNTMLALPRTKEMLDLICARVHYIQDRYKIPFLLENIVHLLPDAPADFSDAQFLNELTRRTGCGLILDAYNLECDAHNHHFDISAFLNELDFSPVKEIHIAGGTEYKGFKLDIHTNLVSNSTIDLTMQLLNQPSCQVKTINYELLPEAINLLGHEAICEELKRLSQIFNTHCREFTGVSS